MDIAAEAVWHEAQSFKLKELKFRSPKSNFSASQQSFSASQQSFAGTRQSRASHAISTTGRQRRRTGPKRSRHHRAHYSAWEAYTHIPKIKASWSVCAPARFGSLVGLAVPVALERWVCRLACRTKERTRAVVWELSAACGWDAGR
eukprot:2713855-Rhodomonas_salina.2